MKLKFLRIHIKMVWIKIKILFLELMLNKIPRLFRKNSEHVYVYDLYEDDLFELGEQLKYLKEKNNDSNRISGH